VFKNKLYDDLSPLAYIPISSFLVSKEIGVLKIRTGCNVGSDHLQIN